MFFPYLSFAYRVLTLIVDVLGPYGGPPRFPLAAPPGCSRGVRGEGGSKPPIGSAIVAMAAAIITIANVVIAAVVELQQPRS